MYRAGKRWESRSGTRQSQSASVPRVSPTAEFVFGAQPVSEALRAKRRTFRKLFLREGDLENQKLLRSERLKKIISIRKKYMNFFKRTWQVY